MGAATVGSRSIRELRICMPQFCDSKNTVRGYCLDIPRFEESLNNSKQHTNKPSRSKVLDSKNGETASLRSPIAAASSISSRIVTDSPGCPRTEKLLPGSATLTAAHSYALLLQPCNAHLTNHFLRNCFFSAEMSHGQAPSRPGKKTPLKPRIQSNTNACLA